VNIASQIKFWRIQRGLSKSKMARMLGDTTKGGVNRRSIASWESEAHRPSLPGLLKIADVLNVSLDELVGRAAPLSEREQLLINAAQAYLDGQPYARDNLEKTLEQLRKVRKDGE